MAWYHYLAAFFSGVLLANCVPHMVHGISGDRFPTPFAKPSGIGLSSPTLNVIWSLINLNIGCLLFAWGKIGPDRPWTLVLLHVGVAVMAISLSKSFQRKQRDNS